MDGQQEFPEIIVEASERHRAALDELRTKVQAWFESLSPRQKDALGAWVNGAAEYDMFVALAAAAGDWDRTRRNELVKGVGNGKGAGLVSQVTA